MAGMAEGGLFPLVQTRRGPLRRSRLDAAPLQPGPESVWQEGLARERVKLIHPDFYLISRSPRRSGSCELIAALIMQPVSLMACDKGTRLPGLTPESQLNTQTPFLFAVHYNEIKLNFKIIFS